ncbi:AbiH family protein [Chitinophagaceae bacterium MMS25-I14]
MNKKILLVGNDINNLQPNNSWKDLLHDMITFCKADKLITDISNKPFPLLYEEIFLTSLRKAHRHERELKQFISDRVSAIEGNAIHERIRTCRIKDIITTNYDFTLEGVIPERNNGVIDERVYSIFRHYRATHQNVWHIHGDCRIPASINLGFEHYGGQLQQIRNYVVTGTNYTSKAVSKLPLIKRLETGPLNNQSWIDFFFNSDIYIFGLSLDFVETDIWWLLTYRARSKYYRRRNIRNSIYYFIPKEYVQSSKAKLDLLRANGVMIIDTLSAKDKETYYSRILDKIQLHEKQ